MQEFSSGATRSSSEGKNDYEGFLSPLVIKGFGDYMRRHQVQADGKLRESDNWQKGMPMASYLKSAWRHFFTLWCLWRGWPVEPEQVGTEKVTPTMLDAIFATMFNLQGLAHELMKQELQQKAPETAPPTSSEGFMDALKKVREQMENEQVKMDPGRIIPKPWDTRLWFSDIRS